MLRKIITFIFIFLVVTPIYAKYNVKDLIELMEKNNLSINEDKITLKEIENEIKVSKGLFFPKISYGANASFITNPIKEINVPVDQLLGSIEWPVGVTPVTNGEHLTVYEGMENTFYSFGLGLMQPIATWGKLASQLSIANYLKEIQQSKSSLNILSKSAQIKTIMQSLYYLDKMLLLYDSSRLNSEELTKLVSEIEKSGMTINKQVMEASVSTFALSYAVNKAMAEIDKQLQSLNDLTGMNLSIEELEFEPLKIEDCSQIINFSDFDLIAKATSPEKEVIKMSNLNISMAEEKKKIADSGVFYKPDISLFASLTYSGSRFPFVEKGWYTKDRYNAIIALRASGILYDAGTQFHRIKINNLGVEKTTIQKKNTINQLSKSIKVLKNEIVVSMSSISHKEAVVKEKSEAFRVANEEYNTGTASRIDYLKADIEKTIAEADVYTEYIKLITSYYMLSSLI